MHPRSGYAVLNPINLRQIHANKRVACKRAQRFAAECGEERHLFQLVYLKTFKPKPKIK